MGRTLPTTTELLLREIEEWKPFRSALPKKERKEFDMMLQSSQLYRHAMMMSLPQHPVPFRPIMMSVIFRHYQQLLEVKKELEGRKQVSQVRKAPEIQREANPPSQLLGMRND